MQAYQRDFIRFAIERGVLRFGEFTLKSGRTSPISSMPACSTAAWRWPAWDASTPRR